MGEYITPFNEHFLGLSGDIDFVFRISKPLYGDLQIDGPIPTDYFRKIIYQHYIKQINVLVEAIKSQKRLIEYNSFYNSYISGGLNEDEFKEISDSYSYNINRDIDQNDLAEKIDILLNLTNTEFTTNEISEIFKCDYDFTLSTLLTLRDQKRID